MTARRRWGALAVLLSTVLSTAGCGVLGADDVKTLSASFDRTVGVYVQSDVRVLGVPIGRVTAVTPEGNSVRVDMEYDAKYTLPADAKAVVVAPSIVSDRYVQITPAYTGGPVLAEGSTLGLDRTQVPLELDQIYANLNRLNLALGPKGANKNGALSDLLSVGADNLEGNGQVLGTTLEDFSQAVKTLSDNRDDLFGTIRNLQDFTSTIARSDDTVRTFNRDLADVAAQLAGERQDLARAVQQLSVALGDVAVFVRENRDSLSTNVAELAKVTQVLVDQKVALEEFLDTAPTALSNLQLAYNPSTGTLDTRDNGPGQAGQMPLGILCTLLQEADNGAAIIGGLPPQLQDRATQLAAACRTATTGGGGPGAAAAPPSTALPVPGAAAAAAVPVPADRSLAALLLGTR